jgi:hypothetical protein
MWPGGPCWEEHSRSRKKQSEEGRTSRKVYLEIPVMGKSSLTAILKHDLRLLFNTQSLWLRIFPEVVVLSLAEIVVHLQAQLGEDLPPIPFM